MLVRCELDGLGTKFHSESYERFELGRKGTSCIGMSCRCFSKEAGEDSSCFLNNSRIGSVFRSCNRP